jgi:hypothetical protein
METHLALGTRHKPVTEVVFGTICTIRNEREKMLDRRLRYMIYAYRWIRAPVHTL